MPNRVATGSDTSSVAAMNSRARRHSVARALKPFPNFSSYSSSKAAIIRFTETVAKELENYNIDINAIAPGAMKTKMTFDVLKADDLAGEELHNAEKVIESGGSNMKKVTDLALFLASDQSNGLSGKTISAQWDDLEFIKNNISSIQNSNKFTMRRIE